MSAEKIASATITRLSLPLVVPYKLAFGPVAAFDTVLCKVVTSEGRVGLGEATILTGYTPETIEGCWREMCGLADALVGETLPDACDIALRRHHDAPFSVTAVVSAIEMAMGHAVLSDHVGQSVPLLAILNATEEQEISDEISRHAAAGYKTIKVKVGWQVEDDLKRVAFIQSCLSDDVTIRIDGNQGFSKVDGVTFASSLAPDNIELLEQPCHMDDWDAAAAVAKVSTVPFMLDESIYGADEIQRAADVGGVQYIKLKLMKAGSLDRLMAQLALIRDLGMRPVLGNGVAADLGCWMEACVAAALVDNAGEMNGYLKPHVRLFQDPMRVENGSVVLPENPTLVDVVPFARAEYSVGPS